MNEAAVTFQGWVGNEVVHRETPQGSVANLRVGSTPGSAGATATGWTARPPGSR